MKFYADLHLHSHYSRATSKYLTLEYLALWARLKGIQIIGSGDFVHPGWMKELKEKLEPAEEGLFRLKPEYDSLTKKTLPPAEAAERWLRACDKVAVDQSGDQSSARTELPERKPPKTIPNRIVLSHFMAPPLF